MEKEVKMTSKSAKTSAKNNNKERKHLEYLIFLTKRGAKESGEFGGSLLDEQVKKMERRHKLLKN